MRHVRVALIAVASIISALSSACGADAIAARTFLALGDSYTIGQSVARDENFPVQLAALLKSKGIDTADPVIIARTGWTTGELSAGIDSADPKGTFDLVTLLIGVNNQFRGRPRDEYQKEFTVLLERAIKFARGDASHVIVVSIPDWGVMPFAEGRDRAAIATDIDAFNKINRDAARKAGARYVDITAESRQAASKKELVAHDGLHPSARMYAEWCQLLLPEASFGSDNKK